MSSDIKSVAKLLLVDNQRKALVLTVGEHKLRPERSYTPDLPGGIVDPGETERGGVVRELKEETGLILDEDGMQLIYTETMYDPHEAKSVSYFLYGCVIDNPPDINLSWEHSDYAWTPLSELDSIDFRSFFKEGIAYALSHSLI